MRDVIVGQKVFIHGGIPVTVIVPPEPTGHRVLVEFGGGPRDWVSTPDICTSQAESLSLQAREKLSKLSGEIRDLTWKLSDLTKEHERLSAIVHPDKADESSNPQTFTPATPGSGSRASHVPPISHAPLIEAPTVAGVKRSGEVTP